MRVKLTDLKRVAVVGSSCSGKTTFAVALAKLSGISHVQLDTLFWLENWRQQPSEVFAQKVAATVSKDAWIIDGNFTEVQHLTLKRATTIVWLNYSFATVFFRAICRSCQRVVTREELFAGNRESFWKTFFTRDSILYWIITTFSRRRRQYRKLFAERPDHIAFFIEFTRPKEAQEFLDSLEIRSM